MKRFVQGEARAQLSLLHECLDDYVTEDNPVRVVEAFIDTLDLEKLERSIERYFYRLDKMDQKVPEVVAIQAPMIEENIASLKEALVELNALEPELHKTEDKQISLTDADARSLWTRGTGIVGYNVQSAVEPDHHLIVAHEVTNPFNDHRQLSPMAIAAKQAMGVDELDAVADRGYFKGEEVLA